MTSPLLSYSPLFPMILIHPFNYMYLLSICDVPVCVCVCVCVCVYKVSALQKLNKRARQESMAIYMENLLALRGMTLLLSPGLYCLPYNRPIN